MDFLSVSISTWLRFNSTQLNQPKSQCICTEGNHSSLWQGTSSSETQRQASPPFHGPHRAAKSAIGCSCVHSICAVDVQEGLGVLFVNGLPSKPAASFFLLFFFYSHLKLPQSSCMCVFVYSSELAANDPEHRITPPGKSVISNRHRSIYVR